MQFEPRTEVLGAGDQSWLGSAHATGNASTVTLDVSTFESLKATHGGIIPAGVPLKDLGNGKHGLLTTASEKLAGFLFTAQSNAGAVQVAPMLWHGRIRVDRLPKGIVDVTTIEEKNPHFVLVKEAS